MSIPDATIALSNGGAIGIARLPRDEDRAALSCWTPDAVLTLVEPGPEADAVGALCRALGIAWHHAPIIDFGTPEAVFESAWAASGPALRARLQGGGRVLVHCRGGLGRSGMIAARLLVELGEAAPDAAIGMVRAARPGAIETAAQEAHVRGVRRVP
jgi:hypothetical protein